MEGKYLCNCFYQFLIVITDHKAGTMAVYNISFVIYSQFSEFRKFFFSHSYSKNAAGKWFLLQSLLPRAANKGRTHQGNAYVM
jgi:hypothetical protein